MSTLGSMQIRVVDDVDFATVGADAVLGPVDGGDRLPQDHRPACSGDEPHWVEADRLRRKGLQIEFQDAATGHTVMAGSVDFAGSSFNEAANLVGDTGQESEHENEPTDHADGRSVDTFTHGAQGRCSARSHRGRCR